MLRAIRRILRPGGRTAFTTIHLPPDLSAERRRRALDAGPSAADTRSRDHVTLLRSAGFIDVEQVDVTELFRTTQRRWLRHAREMEAELAASGPPGQFAERLEEQFATRAALDEGLLRRSLYVARRRGGG